MANYKATVAVAIALALSGCGESKTAQTHLESAAKLIQQNKHSDALIELKNAVKLEPRNQNVRLELAKLHLSTGNGLSAAKEAERAREYGAKSDDSLIILTKAYHIAESSEDVLNLAKDLEKIEKVESQVEFLAYLAAAYSRTGQAQESQEMADNASALLNASVYTMLAQSYADVANQKITLAEARLKEILNIDSELESALLLSGQVAANLGNYDAAIAKFKQYNEIYPDARKVVLLLADALTKTPNYIEAEQYADQILSVFPNQPYATYLKAVVRFIEKDYAQASELAEKAISTDFNHPHLKLIAGSSSFYLQNYELANFHLESIVKYLVPDHPARKMFTVSQLQLGKIDSIAEDLEAFTISNEEDEKFLSSISMNLYNLGAKKEARSLLEKVRQEAKSDNAKANQGFLQLLMNEPGAIDNLEEAINNDASMENTRLAIAYAAMQKGDFTKAEKEAKLWLAGNENKTAGYNVLGAIYTKNKDFSKAKEVLTKSLEDKADNAYALVELSKINFVEGDKEKAKEYAEKLLALKPDDIRALKLNYMVNQNEEAFSLIEKAYLSNMNSDAYINLYVGSLTNEKRYEDAIGVLSKVDKTIRTPKELWKLQLLSHARLNQGNKALQLVKNWRNVNPYHIEPVFYLANYYNKTNNKPEALSVLNKALVGNHADSIMLQLAKLQLLLDTQKLSDAKTLYRSIKPSDLDEKVVAGIEGRIALLEGDFPSAIENLGKFYQQFPSSQNALMLAHAYRSDRNTEKAIETLEDFKKNSDDLRVSNVLANLYLGTDVKKAAAVYKEIVEKQPANSIALNNLAWLAKEDGDYDKALTYANRALELSPSVVNIIDTRAMILFAQGERVQALNEITRAFELSKGENPEVTMNYIDVLIANKRRNKAKQVLANIKSVPDRLTERFVSLNKKLQ